MVAAYPVRCSTCSYAGQLSFIFLGAGPKMVGLGVTANTKPIEDAVKTEHTSTEPADETKLKVNFF